MTTATPSSMTAAIAPADSTATEAPNTAAQTKTAPATSVFLSPNNLCGQTLLELVSRGHGILANIRILSEKVPPAFVAAADEANSNGIYGSGSGGGRGATQEGAESSSGGLGFLNLFGSTRSPQSSKDIAVDLDGSISGNLGGEGDTDDVKKYTPFLFDFSYLHNPEEYEANLSASVEANSSDGNLNVANLEREFEVNHNSTMEEYHALFHSIHQYQADLNIFADDLNKGFFIQYTVESLLLDNEGRALICEAVWLYGAILILMERLLPGPIRERLIIAYYRFCNRNNDISQIDLLTKLCKSTNISPPKSTTPACFTKNPSHKYPMDEDKLFHRFPLPVELVRNVIGTLVSDDIYRQSSAFPSIDHRSTRLSRQASMLYVVLFFDPLVLRDEPGKMREIVDKYFHDNWVIHIYAGLTADLSLEWERFPAAKAALDNVLKLENVKRLHIANAKLIGQCMAELRAYLTMGILTDSFVLDNRHDLLNCLRRCNVAVRWRILHRRTSNSVHHGIICATAEKVAPDPKLEGEFAVNDTHVVSLLLLSSQLELQLKDIFQQLLSKKESIWIGCRAKASQMMSDLSKYFKGDQTLARVSRHDGLMKWFESMATEINYLEYEGGDHFTVTGRKIQLCVQALEEVEQYDLVDRDVQVKSFIHEARSLLLQMARAVGINEDICTDIQFISDLSYASESIKSYVGIIHSRITKDPSNVSLLDGFFLKATSSLDMPVERLKQSNSPDLKKATEYYSSQLVSFVRDVLEVVPVSVFAILVQMSDIIERRLLPLPLKVEGDKLIAFAQLGERYKLAMMAHEISIFCDGIHEMENSFVGEVEVNPRKLLEDGLRKEMVQHISELMNSLLQFDFSADSETTASITKHYGAAMRSMTSLASRLEGFQGALCCIEDYTSINSLKIWHSEMSRIINYNVEQEVNKYLLKKVLDSDSKFQSKIIPIPRFPRTDNEPSCINFMGRVLSMLLKVTDAHFTTFSLERSGWFLSDGFEVCGLKTMLTLRKAIGINGLAGLERLLCYRILHELHRFVKFFRTNVSKQAVLLEQLRDELFPEWRTPPNAVSIYASGSKKTEMLMLPMLTCFRRVGQAQLLRRMVRFELRRCARSDAKALQQSVAAINASILSGNDDLKDDPDSMKKICDLATNVGIGDPMDTVFMATDPLEGLPILLLFFVLFYVPKLTYVQDYASLSKVKGSYPIDGWPVIAGISTLLKQFHSSYAKSFLAYIGQFIRISIQTYAERRQGKKDEVSRLAADLKNSIIFVQQFCDLSNLPSTALHEHVPQYLLELCSDLP
mmetsp:Transcript_27925/g.57947  ORF Transcript_27925/g.57947 Transcript_27925/m.57947 type:complete len:1294 (-) Transcript_27925:92-3973(-)